MKRFVRPKASVHACTSLANYELKLTVTPQSFIPTYLRCEMRTKPFQCKMLQIARGVAQW